MGYYQKCAKCGRDDFRNGFEYREHFAEHLRAEKRYEAAKESGQETLYLKTSAVLQRQQEYNQKCEENYCRLKPQVARAREASTVSEVSSQAWAMLYFLQKTYMVE